MVVGDDVGVSVLWFVDLQVGVLPRELLTRVDGLWSRRRRVVTLPTSIARVNYCSIFWTSNSRPGGTASALGR